MRKFAFVLMMLGTACTNAADPANPMGQTFAAIANGFGSGAAAQTRAQMEVFVKSNHPALIRDIEVGGGPTLNEAYTLANVPDASRDVLTLRLQSDLALYNTNLNALVTAIMLASGG